MATCWPSGDGVREDAEVEADVAGLEIGFGFVPLLRLLPRDAGFDVDGRFFCPLPPLAQLLPPLLDEDEEEDEALRRDDVFDFRCVVLLDPPPLRCVVLLDPPPLLLLPTKSLVIFR